VINNTLCAGLTLSHCMVIDIIQTTRQSISDQLEQGATAAAGSAQGSTNTEKIQ